MIVLLMGAGAGSRFPKSRVPKPFVRVDDRMMYEYVANKNGMFGRTDTYFVTQTAFAKYDAFEHKTRPSHYFSEDTIFVPDLVAAGPAWSAVAASLRFDDHEPLLLVDSDCFVEMNKEDHYLMKSVENQDFKLTTEVVVYSTISTEDMSGVAQVDIDPDDAHITIKEGGVKKGELINVGAYWFRSLREFRNRVFGMQQEHSTEKELKISDVVNGFEKVKGLILNGKFVNLGSEELLAAYRKEKNYG